MKILFALLACLAAVWPLAPRAASAEEAATYARIMNENVYFYARADADSGLFVLPRTYFVRIAGEAGNYYAAEYRTGSAALSGYCLKAEVEPVDYIPETPFLDYRTEVTFETEGADGLPADFITRYTVPADFYGTFPYGSATYYYVSLEGTYGYVSETACPPLDYPLNTEHMQEETPPAETPQSGGVNAVNIVLICALSVAAIGAVYFLFRPSKTPRPRQTYGDDAEDFF